MADNITALPGDKLRANGQTIRLTEAAIVVGEVIKTKAQQNRHNLIMCQSDRCRQWQQDNRRGKIQKFRASADTCITDSINSPFPPCPLCGVLMAFEKGEN